MKQNRRAWLDFLASPGIEGGYVNDPQDAGGPTSMGITQATLAAWRGHPVTAEDVASLTRDEAEAIASATFWNKVQGDRLPPGIDVMVADFAYNSGPARAVFELQRLLGVTVDGHVGPKTLAACLERDPIDLINDYHDARLRYLRSLAGWKRFGAGWEARCLRLGRIALGLATEQQAPEPAPATKAKVSLGAAVAAAGAVTAAGPEIKSAYEQAAQATEPLAVLASWLPAAIGLAVAVVCVAVIVLKSRKLADAVS